MLKPLQSKRISNVEKAVKVVRSAKAEKATVAVRGSVSNGDHIEHIIIHPRDAKDSTEGKRSSWFVFDINGKLTGTAYPNLDSAVSDLRKKFSSTDQDETAIYFDEISV